MNRFLLIGGLVLTAALIAPLTVQANDRDHQDNRRYYDRDARDYHQWDNNEDRAYRAYLQNQHREYVQFHRVNRGRQRQYFKWRHEHPNNTLFKLEIR